MDESNELQILFLDLAFLRRCRGIQNQMGVLFHIQHSKTITQQKEEAWLVLHLNTGFVEWPLFVFQLCGIIK